MLCLVLIGLVLVHHGAEATKKEKGKGKTSFSRFLTKLDHMYLDDSD